MIASKASSDPALYRRLLGAFCEALLRHQIRDHSVPALRGGLLCPACARVHGRSIDAVYPLLAWARQTADRRFTRVAVELFDFSEHLGAPDGSWTNEPNGDNWKGTTVFAVISVAEALRHHGDLLDGATRKRWRERLRAAAHYLTRWPSYPTAAINYQLSAPAALALAGTVLEDEALLRAARTHAALARGFFLPESKLVFGEGARGKVSARGTQGVDVGYNVEETLPNLTLYTRLVRDEALEALVVASLERHLDLLLPDGAWDAGWCTRNFKWTYWGSRTTDGCQPAYGLLGARDPRFAEAAARNAALLARCTHDGVLYGGPHVRAHGEPPCLHHTFCHAKAMATLVDAGIEPPRARVALPRDADTLVVELREVLTTIVCRGPWTGTITAYDTQKVKDAHPMGGAPAVLYHRDVGPLLVASMTRYAQPEPANMPRVRGADVCLTSRLVQGEDERFSNVFDPDTRLTTRERKGETTIEARGTLRDDTGKTPGGGAAPFALDYTFAPDRFTLRAAAQATTDDSPVRLWLPIVSLAKEPVRGLGTREVEIHKGTRRVRVRASAPLLGWDNARRAFNHVPGMEALPLWIALPASGERAVSVEVTVA